MKQLGLRVDDEMHGWLVRTADGVPLNRFVVRMLEEARAGSVVQAQPARAAKATVWPARQGSFERKHLATCQCGVCRP